MSKIIKIDGKYYDFGTKNSSFLLTAQELKTLGIKNWYFMLEVKYPNLKVQDIDPHNPNITSDEVAKIHIESKVNVWFWLRECALIPVRGAPKPYELTLTRASCAAIWCYSHNIDFLLCQPRQTWKTTIVILLITYTFVYGLKNATIPLMHLNEKKVVQNATMLKEYIEALPNYMNPFSNKRKIGIKSMQYEEHRTNISLLTSAESETIAADKLRGDTLFVGFLDEWEYMPFIDSVVMGGTPAIISGRIIAKQNNGVACMMYASTPGNLETPQGKASQKIIDKTPPWSEQYYDFTDEEILNSFDGVESTNPETGEKDQITMVYIEYDYKQLRRDENWLRTQYNEAIRFGKIDEYRRGVLLQRYRGSDSVLFEQEDIDYIVQNTKQPDYDIFIFKKFHLYCYKHDIKAYDLTSDTPYFDINIPYLIGMDVASGSGGDSTTFCVVQPYTLEVVAEFTSPYIGTIDQMRVITYLIKLIPRGIFCVETNNIGKAIVDFVQESQLESHFYHDPKLDMSKNPITMENKELSIKAKSEAKQYIGTWVSTNTRKDMFQILLRHVKDYRHLLLTKYVAKDITNLVRIKDKIQADRGEHDDMIMAYLHTLYVLYYGHDLTRFGIDKKLCTFEKVYDVINKYEQELIENTIDNAVPYDTATVYEEQLLHDLTSNTNTGYGVTDEYGYSRKQYQDGSLYNEQEYLSASDIAFFREVNSY